MDRGAGRAARNNAEWCDLVCRAHGIDTDLDRDAWVARRRSPPLYPDAVTLREHPATGELLARIDISPGCSIKDSFASVDLSAEGFRLLFEAEWIYRPPVRDRGGSRLRWSGVRTAGELRTWAAAHGGGEVFHPDLLDDPAVAVMAAHDDGELVAGVIGSRSASVVGLSNLFILTADPDEVWAGASGVVSARFPGLPLVGYENDASLQAARRSGFVSVGPLRVWLKN
jgi:hypothetical protein